MERVNWLSRVLTFAAVIAVVLASAYFLSRGGSGQAPGQIAAAPAAAPKGTTGATTSAAPQAVQKGTPARSTAGGTVPAGAVAGRAPANAAPAVAATTNPYFDQTVLMSQAFGLEMISRRLTLIDRYTMSAPLLRQVRKMPHIDFARIHGTLRTRDPQLADEMFQAMWAVIDAAANGGDVPGTMAKMKGILATARDTLISPAFQRTTVYKGALAIDLLLAGDGVAEAFEEAFVDPAEYPNGWVALQRVKQLWAELEPLANEAAKAEARSALAALDTFYPNPVPPASMAATGHIGEDAEAEAQHLANIIEQVVQADLFPGRDLIRLTEHLTALTGTACVAYDTGEDYIGQETAYAVGHHYGQQLIGLLGIMNPTLNAGIVELLGKLVSVDDLMDEPPELIAAQQARQRQRGPILDDDDDDAPTNEPGWIYCPDLEFLMQKALATLRG